MSNIPTPWGYNLKTGEPLPELMSSPEFQTATANKYADNARVAGALKAASAIIRNYCGWHIYPRIPCELVTTMYDRKVTMVRNELLIQLPAKMVTSVDSVSIDGIEVTGYTFDRAGIVHVYHNPVPCAPRHTTIAIEYTAGLDEQQAADIRDIAASRAVHGLSNPAGVQSEAAGGVSVTYNAAWTQGGGAGALSTVDIQTLNTWRLQGVY